MPKKQYRVTYTVIVESEELPQEQIIDKAWNIMESIYIKPIIEDITKGGLYDIR